MWQLWTERAREVVVFAKEEAVRLRRDTVTPDHLLLGLLRVEDCVASKLLIRLGTSADAVRAAMESRLTSGDTEFSDAFQLSLEARDLINLFYDESTLIGNNYIGTEHVLLGMAN
jgi:ATP-dependent Clp protease ATP-binding subunit ClpC